MIVGELQTKTKQRCGKNRFEIDAPLDGDVATKDIFFALKEAWNIARHTIGGEDMFATSADSDNEDDHLITAA